MAYKRFSVCLNKTLLVGVDVQGVDRVVGPSTWAPTPHRHDFPGRRNVARPLAEDLLQEGSPGGAGGLFGFCHGVGVLAMEQGFVLSRA